MRASMYDNFQRDFVCAGMSANPTLNSDLKTVFHNDLPGWRVKDYLQIHLNMNQDCTFQIWLFGCKWEMELVTMWHLLMVLTKTSRDVGMLYHIIVALSNSTLGTWLRDELLSPPSMTGIICEQTQLDTKYWPKCNKMLTLSAEISCSIWSFVPFGRWNLSKLHPRVAWVVTGPTLRNHKNPRRCQLLQPSLDRTSSSLQKDGSLDCIGHVPSCPQYKWSH